MKEPISKEQIAVLLDREQRVMEEMSRLLRSAPDPEHWPEPYRQIFAQAVLPALREAPGKAPVLRLEHAKGLRLMFRVYGGQGRRATVESIPAWIVQAARKDRRDPRWERMAERVRHNLRLVIGSQKA